jgi:hypothetical protein
MQQGMAGLQRADLGSVTAGANVTGRRALTSIEGRS